MALLLALAGPALAGGSGLTPPPRRGVAAEAEQETGQGPEDQRAVGSRAEQPARLASEKAGTSAAKETADPTVDPETTSRDEPPRVERAAGGERLAGQPLTKQPATERPAPPAAERSAAPRRVVLQGRESGRRALRLEGVWRVETHDRRRGRQITFLRFTRRADGAFATARYAQLAPGRPAAEPFRRGAALVDGRGRVLLKEELNEGPGFLDSLDVAKQIVEGGRATRRAVLHPGPFGHTLQGAFRWTDGRAAGRERLDRAGRTPRDNAVDLLADGGEMFPLLREELKRAERTIHLQTFIYTDDPTGRSVGGILMAQARRGVEVRVLVDAAGDYLGDLKGDLEDAGVEVIVQHGYAKGVLNSLGDVARGAWGLVKRLFGGGPPEPRERRGLFNHDHRKITVIDGDVGFIGGMNIADEYEFELRDVHARVRGSAARELEDLFRDRWRAAGGGTIQDPPEAAQEAAGPRWGPGHLPVDVVASLPGVSTAIKDRYLAEIDGAKRRVLIEMAYFLDDSIIDALQDAEGRGVRTLVLLPPDEHNDVGVVRDAFNWVQNDVVRSGVELYKLRGRHVHAKVATFDGHTATIGSSNLDNMALTRLAEANLFVPDADFTRLVDRRIFARDVPRSDRVKLQEQSWWQKVKSGTLHFFRSFL